MKISVIGSGAMGSLFGGKLSLSGIDVVLYDINRIHIERILLNGLEIEEPSTGEILKAYPMATSNQQDVEGSDLMLVFVKSTSTDSVAREFARYAHEGTIVLTLQNGLGNEDILCKYFGRNRTAVGVTSQGATFLAPGIIRHAGSGPTRICMSDNQNEKLSGILRAFLKSGFEVSLERNIADLVWSKLIINIGINALTAITGLENGKLLEYPEIKQIIADLVEEAVNVAEKKSVKLSYSNPLQQVYKVIENTGLNRSSMLQDFDRGDLTEIDFINNAIVKEGRKLGIETPCNSLISRLVKSLELINRERMV